jgi:hypothetical protein
MCHLFCHSLLLIKYVLEVYRNLQGGEKLGGTSCGLLFPWPALLLKGISCLVKNQGTFLLEIQLKERS